MLRIKIDFGFWWMIIGYVKYKFICDFRDVCIYCEVLGKWVDYSEFLWVGDENVW